MKHWKERILQMRFRKLVKRLAILSICVVLLGVILSVVLLQPQISQITSAAQQAEQIDGFREGHFCDWESWDRESWDREGWDDAYGITEPTLPVKCTLLAIGAVFFALFAVWWLLVPAWLYQASKRAQMNTLLWPLLGLVWSLWGLLLFLVARSLLRQRCSSCGAWQKSASFCRACGAKLHVTCPSCGAECSPGGQYCSHCGSSLKLAEDSEATHETR